MCFNHWQLYFSFKFNVSQCDKSLAAGFILINTWQQRASMPFKPTQGHRLQVKISSLMFMEKWPNYFSYQKVRFFNISERRQSNTLWTINEPGSQIARNSVIDGQLSPVGRQTAIENSVSNDLRSMFLNSTNLFDWRLSERFIEYTEKAVKTIPNKGSFWW